MRGWARGELGRFRGVEVDMVEEVDADLREEAEEFMMDVERGGTRGARRIPEEGTEEELEAVEEATEADERLECEE